MSLSLFERIDRVQIEKEAQNPAPKKSVLLVVEIYVGVSVKR